MANQTTADSQPDQSAQRPPSANRLIFLVGLLLVALGSFFFLQIMKFSGGINTEINGGLQVGADFLPIRATDWINGEPPSFEELKGKVVLIDAWATWCSPCLKSMPELVKLHKQYGDQVVFISVTAEDIESLSEIEHVVDKFGMTWHVGYGGQNMMDDYKVTGFPSLWLIGSDGKIVWNIDSKEGLEVSIRNTLRSAEDS